MILHLFTLLFVALKLLGNIDWSWWLVLAPSIVGVALSLGIMVFALIMAAIVARSK